VYEKEEADRLKGEKLGLQAGLAINGGG